MKLLEYLRKKLALFIQNFGSKDLRHLNARSHPEILGWKLGLVNSYQIILKNRVANDKKYGQIYQHF